MYILGICCYRHEASACLIGNGKMITACEEERFNRIKHTGAFPINAINFCLNKANIKMDDVDYVGFYTDPWLALRKRIPFIIRYLPKFLAWFNGYSGSFLSMIRIQDTLKKAFKMNGRFKRFCFIPHHLAHSASTFFVSPFSEAAILSIDGVGEWTTTMFAYGKNNKIRVLKEIVFPHSIGYLYAAITQFLGFQPDSMEGKVMGLAAYGKPAYYKEFRKMVKFTSDGGYKLDLNYFDFHFGKTRLYSNKMLGFFGPARKAGERITEQHANIAASVQQVLEETVLHMVGHLYKLTGLDRLCLAGGVALNSVMNAKILEQSPFNEIFIQPAAHEAGTSVGAVFYLYHQMLENPRTYSMEDAFLGPEYADDEILQYLKKYNLNYTYVQDIEKIVAKILADGLIVGWFQGRMELGPRALGNRSILADPRNPNMKDILNKKVKHRESFRPYSPAILEEKCSEYFTCLSTDRQCDYPSTYMLLVYEVRAEKRKLIPAVTHIDGTARVQTVIKETNPKFYNLIYEFEKLTGIPVMLNTSFNLQGEPIVCSPKDALEMFINTEMDALCLNNFLVKK